MADDSFYVKAKIGLAEYSVTVLPKWENDQDDSYFTIRVLPDIAKYRWEWVKGGFSQDEADDIGNKIDAYYD
ncbi:hypothetical protein WG906_06000 [Pedobacter sp. P351]|uniref:hypothetical protein n=1 Tax=Pedobacter superstes TaxID=3133441 RepID=UPI0030B4CC4F